MHLQRGSVKYKYGIYQLTQSISLLNVRHDMKTPCTKARYHMHNLWTLTQNRLSLTPIVKKSELGQHFDRWRNAINLQLRVYPTSLGFSLPTEFIFLPSPWLWSEKAKVQSMSSPSDNILSIPFCTLRLQEQWWRNRVFNCISALFIQKITPSCDENAINLQGWIWYELCFLN